MKKYLCAVIVASICTIAPVRAADVSKTLTNEKALALLAAMRNLDGRMVVVKTAQGDATIMQPWTFKNAQLRLRIKRNIKALEPVQKVLEETQQAMLAAAQAKAGYDADGKPKPVDISKDFLELMRKPVEGPVDLGRIKASELMLNENEIPGTALAGADPILDDDVSPKESP